MRKKAAIIFILIYASSVIQLQEFLAIPIMVQHFVKHQQNEKSIDLVSFIKMHYFNGDVKDADYNEDMKLPFKSIDNFGMISVGFTLPIFTEFSAKVEYLEYAPFQFFEIVSKEQSYYNLLLRPPIAV